MKMTKFKGCNTYCLDYDSQRLQRYNLEDLKSLQIKLRVVKEALELKIHLYKKNNIYINISCMEEYIYLLGVKKLLKRANKDRKYIKNFIKNMNKPVGSNYEEQS